MKPFLPMLALVAAVAFAPVAGAQLAKGGKKPLSPDQVKAGLFGIDMEGYSPTYKFRWRECIDPNGRTLYETPNGVQKGILTVTGEGFACFSYEDTGYTEKSCYAVSRNGKGFLFDGAFGEVYVTTRVVSGVTECKPPDELIS
jgi:hypothetical protein